MEEFRNWPKTAPKSIAGKTKRSDSSRTSETTVASDFQIKKRQKIQSYQGCPMQKNLDRKYTEKERKKADVRNARESTSKTKERQLKRISDQQYSIHAMLQKLDRKDAAKERRRADESTLKTKKRQFKKMCIEESEESDINDINYYICNIEDTNDNACNVISSDSEDYYLPLLPSFMEKYLAIKKDELQNVDLNSSFDLTKPEILEHISRKFACAVALKRNPFLDREVLSDLLESVHSGKEDESNLHCQENRGEDGVFLDKEVLLETIQTETEALSEKEKGSNFHFEENKDAKRNEINKSFKIYDIIHSDDECTFLCKVPKFKNLSKKFTHISNITEHAHNHSHLINKTLSNNSTLNEGYISSTIS